jgi:hypothetical protein
VSPFLKGQRDVTLRRRELCERSAGVAAYAAARKGGNGGSQATEAEAGTLFKRHGRGAVVAQRYDYAGKRMSALPARRNGGAERILAKSVADAALSAGAWSIRELTASRSRMRRPLADHVADRRAPLTAKATPRSSCPSSEAC